MVLAVGDKGDIDLLVELGLSKTQAKCYLLLLNMGKTEAKTLAKQANIPRQAAYRILEELQEKGLIEKMVGARYEFKAIDIDESISSMLRKKAAYYLETAQKVTELIQRYQSQEKLCTNKEYQISILESKDAIIKKNKRLIENSQEIIYSIQNWQCWFQMIDVYAEPLEDALQRGVKYHVIIDKEATKIVIPKALKFLTNRENVEVRVQDNIRVKAMLFDNNFGCFSFYPDKAILEAPVIVTNHPSLLVCFQDHFAKLWNESKKALLN